MERLVEVASSGLMYSVSVIIALWTAGAIYYDVGRGSIVGWVLSIGWITAVALAFMFWQPPHAPFMALLAGFVTFLFWWFRQRPSHERAWDPNFAQLPHLEIDGDTLTIYNLRNSEYPALGEVTPRFETRTVRISRLRGLDSLILHWESPWMSHPMFIFDFGAGCRICISVEVRYRIGQEFGILRTLYRQQELMYVVSDERDAILKRTRYGKGENLYLYRWNIDPIEMRHVLFDYVYSINQIAAHPRWYNGVTSNCTTSIYAQTRTRMDWHWYLLFNANLDRLMYERGRLDQNVPFETLKRESWLNEIANSAPPDDFGEHIRRELSGYVTPKGTDISINS
jgi:hypothetical protein